MSVHRKGSNSEFIHTKHSLGMPYKFTAVAMLGLSILGGFFMPRARTDLSGYPQSYIFGKDSYNDLVRGYVQSACKSEKIAIEAEPIFNLGPPSFYSNVRYISERCPEQFELFEFSEKIVQVVQYFPLHTNAIIEEAEKCHSQVENTPILYNLKKHPGNYSLEFAKILIEKNTVPMWTFLCDMGGRRFDEEMWEARFPLDRSIEKASEYIVQKAGFVNAFNYEKDQIHYGASMHQSVLIAAAHIEQGYSFRQILSLLALRRNQIAMKARMGARLDFGRTLLEQSYTPCDSGGYSELGRRLQELVLIESPFVEKIEAGRYQLKAPLGKQWISHSLIAIEEEMMGVEHTQNLETRELILKEVEQLYTQALQETDRARFTQKLGEIFWWICQAKPWSRGDPSIAETLIKAVAHYKKMPIPGWKETIVPWEEVMKTFDPIEFATKFHTLFRVFS